LKVSRSSVQDDTEANALRIYGTIKHQSRTLRFELSFVRWLGDEDENGDAEGQGLCPILYGIGFMADGYTYMRVKITEVLCICVFIWTEVKSINSFRPKKK
jgi:hypothetical protein